MSRVAPIPSEREPVTALSASARRAGVPPVRRIDRLALGLAALVLSLGIAAALAASVAVREERPAAEGTVEVPIAGRAVALPAAWLREREGERVDLRIPLEAFAGTAAPAGAAALVRLVPTDGTMAPAERAPLLYARFLAPSAVPSPGGLIRREFRAGSPFDGETLHLAPPDGRAFAARCLEPRPGLARETCLAEIRAGATDIQLRLAPEHLAHWQAVTRGLTRLAGG